MPSITVVPRTDEKSKRCGVLLRLLINHDDWRIYVTTRLKAKQNDWNPNKRKIRTSNPQNERLNGLLKNTVKKAHRAILGIREKNINLTAERVRQEISGTRSGVSALTGSSAAPPTEIGSACVSTPSAPSHIARRPLVYDLDESETTETLDAPSQGVNYTTPSAWSPRSRSPAAERTPTDAADPSIAARSCSASAPATSTD